MPDIECVNAGDPKPHLNDLVFRRVVDTNPNAVWLLHLDGKIAYANARAKTTIGEIDSENWCDQWPPSNQAASNRAFDAALKGKPSRYRAFVSLHQTGRIYLDVDLSPLFYGDRTFQFLLCTAEDVTASVEEVSFLRSVIQQLPLSLTAKDADTGRYILFNRAAEDLYGISAEDTIGCTAAEAFQADRADAIGAADDRAVHSYEARLAVEEEFTDAPTARFISTRRAVTYDDAGPRHLVTLGEDITERRANSEALRVALESAEQASTAKSMFIANMNHEIRTPLNSVIAAAQMLADSALDQRQRKLASLIQAGGNTLCSLLSDILEVVRMEAGVVSLEAAPFRIANLIREAAQPFRLEAERRNLGFTQQVAPVADRWVMGDERRIGRVIDILLGNALKFTEQGSVSIALETRGADAYRVTVTDTGVGFDHCQKDAIFQRFEQCDTTHSRRFGGAGLGLAICRELCDLMGAQINCSSLPGKGSEFWLDLHLPSAPPRSEATATEVETPPNLSILIAEDNAANRAVLGLLLDEVAEVCMVENGAQAVETLRSRSFDLVLMDMQMPKMDGLTATSAIRDFERSMGRCSVPVIMLTANTHPDHVAASLAAGANLHLAKPITPATLFDAMNSVLAA